MGSVGVEGIRGCLYRLFWKMEILWVFIGIGGFCTDRWCF